MLTNPVRKKAAHFRVRPLLMEAEGIEPSSQDNVDAGLYMLSKCFDLERIAGHLQSASRSSRLCLIR
jgi:hypothetical protein